MTARTFEIQVQDDHLERIAQTRKPLLALAELIWNTVDADATHIDVTLVENDLDGLKRPSESPTTDMAFPLPKPRGCPPVREDRGNNRDSIRTDENEFCTARKEKADSAPSRLVASLIGTCAPLTTRINSSPIESPC